MALEKTYTLVTQLMCQNHILGQNIQNHIFLLFYNSLDIHLSVRMCKSRSCIIHNKQISSSHFATTEFTHPTSICLTLQTKKKKRRLVDTRLNSVFTLQATPLSSQRKSIHFPLQLSQRVDDKQIHQK